MGHYGGNMQDPRFHSMLQRLALGGEGQQRVNQSFVGQLGAGVWPRGYQPYGGHNIPGGTHVAAAVHQLRS